MDVNSEDLSDVDVDILGYNVSNLNRPKNRIDLRYLKNM